MCRFCCKTNKSIQNENSVLNCDPIYVSKRATFVSAYNYYSRDIGQQEMKTCTVFFIVLAGHAVCVRVIRMHAGMC